LITSSDLQQIPCSYGAGNFLHGAGIFLAAAGISSATQGISNCHVPIGFMESIF